jgi:8-oxo-dGTP pyrophosphatase MutT (NUDIX family)
MQDPDVIPRRAARLLVLDPAGRVLLLQGFDPARPETLFWFTIGGGLDTGETAIEAAVRELREEAGIGATAADLAGPVWRRNTEFSFDGSRYRQDEEYYLLRVGSVEVSLAGLDDIERETVTGYRWWAPDELAATDEAFFPPELPELLRRVTATGRDAADPER